MHGRRAGKRNHGRKLALAGSVCLLASAASHRDAFAQAPGSQQLERFERQLEQIQRDIRVRVDSDAIPADQRVLIDYGGYTTASFVAIDDPDQETHVLRQYDLVGYARINLDGVHEVFARGRTTYRDFNSGDAFSNHGDDWVEPTLDRAHYRFDLQRALSAYGGEAVDYNVVVQAGRQLVSWANGLTLSEEIDGVTATFTYDKLSLDAVAGVTRPSIADFDSSRPGFLGDTHRGFCGGLLTLDLGKHRAFVYGLVQQDYNHSDTLVTGDVTTRFDYDSFYVGVGSSGNLTDNLLYAVEAAYEGGQTLSNSFEFPFVQVEQTRDDIEAFALDARLEYLLNDKRRTRFSAELILATGDPDRLTTSNTFGGNRPDTDDHAFNSFGLLNTGLAFAPDVSNLLMVRGGVSTFPFPEAAPFRQLQVGADLFAFNKLRRGGPIDESTSDDRYLGCEADLFVNWQVSSDVSFTLRYGAFFPGQAIETDHDERHLFYTGITYAF